MSDRKATDLHVYYIPFSLLLIYCTYCKQAKNEMKTIFFGKFVIILLKMRYTATLALLLEMNKILKCFLKRSYID